MTERTFAIPVNPAELPTAQQKGIRIIKCRGKLMPMFYEKANVREAHNLLHAELKKHAPQKPAEGPVELFVQYRYPYPKGTPKCRTADSAPMIQRPDVDNSQKLLQDVMGEVGFWHDDSQVWRLYLSKIRVTGTPEIVITTRTNDDTLSIA